jgi:excisionase family DNA binding protein
VFGAMARDDHDDTQQPPYRVRDVARKFGVSEKSVRDAIAAGRIPAFRIGKSWLIPPRWVDRQVGEAA